MLHEGLMVLILLFLLHFELLSDPFIPGTLQLNHRFCHSYILFLVFFFWSVLVAVGRNLSRNATLIPFRFGLQGTLEETVEGPKRAETHAVG